MLLDVAAVIISAVLVNYLGLIEAVEKVIRHKLPILDCPRCLTFWSVLLWLVINSTWHIAIIVATSFLASYLANWIELIFGLLDKLYEYIYKKNYPTEAYTKEGDGATYTETT